MGAPMINCLIVEDEPVLANHLQNLLLHLSPDVTVLGIAGSGTQGVEQALALLPHVVFLDIQMPGLTGLEAAELICEQWLTQQSLPLFVFVTAYAQHALRAFDFAAIDYVLKPVTLSRLKITFERIQKRLATFAETEQQSTFSLPASTALQSQSSHALSVKNLRVSIGNKIVFLALSEIIYFEAADKYIRVVTQDHEALIRTPLCDLLKLLNPDEFWQIHRAVIVQVAYIDYLERLENAKLLLHLKGHRDTLIVSRLYANRFRPM